MSEAASQASEAADGIGRNATTGWWRNLDQTLSDWVHRREPGAWDTGLAGLSTAADRGGLWLGTAAVLAGCGGRGRRAAARGLVGLGAASALANGPIKLSIRRTRPAFRALPAGWLPARLPVTTSFPSGHSASAAAFATGAALEAPGLALPLGALAAAVAWSRVNTGVHHPSDVLAGLALGAAVSWGISRLSPVPVDADRGPATDRREPVAEPASMPDLGSGEGLRVVLNLPVDDPAARTITAVVQEAFPKAQLRHPAEGEELPQVLAESAADAVALGVAGGDGTINAAVAAALAAGLPLLVLPAGTLNHFAGALGLDDAEQSVRAALAGTGALVDVAAADVDTGAGGPRERRVFVNNSSIGAYPRMVAARERLETRLGKWPAALLAAGFVLARSEPERVVVDGEPRRIWLLFIGNCRYTPTGPGPLRRDRLDDGTLDVRLLDAARPWSRTRLLLAIAAGRVDTTPVLRSWSARSVHVVAQEEDVPLARDGEVDDPVPAFDWVKADSLRVWAAAGAIRSARP